MRSRAVVARAVILASNDSFLTADVAGQLHSNNSFLEAVIAS